MANDVLMVGISGLRGTVGGSLSPELCARYAMAAGCWFVENHAGKKVKLVVGRDSRRSGGMVERAVVAGLEAVGCDVIMLGVISTPGVAIMAKHLHADGGVMITASHNPIQWNGIKIIREDGVAPPPDEATRIISRFHDEDFQLVDVEGLGHASANAEGAGVHVDQVLQVVDVEAIRAAGLTAVVDSVNGAGGEEARLLLEALGVERVAMNAEPTGWFAHAPEPIAANLTALAEHVPKVRADVGFAQDPDADRLAIVDETGHYIGEEYTLALAGLHLLREGDFIAANLSTSRMIDDVAHAVGAEVVRTAVGEANVAAGMRASGARIGGEGNGGVILSEISQVRDSIVGMALTLEMLATRKQPLSTIVDSIPKYAIIKHRVDATEELKAAIEPKLREAFSEQRIDTQDGVRVDWEDSWVHVRKSNTEPIVRIISEAKDEARAQALIKETEMALGVVSP